MSSDIEKREEVMKKEEVQQQSALPQPIKRKRGRPRKVPVVPTPTAEAKEEAVIPSAPTTPTISTTPAVVEEARVPRQVEVQIPKRLLRRLTKLQDRLDTIEGRLRPLKSIEKDASTIKDMQKQIKSIA
ncbi:MAG: hypothetical protein QXS40_04185, partial [Candidatus Nitrosocaldus sp.]